MSRIWLLLIPLVACTPLTEPSRCSGMVCMTGFTCDPATGSCVPVAMDAGVECTSDPQCGASTPRCLTTEARCVACLATEDCAAGACDLTTHQCAALPDSCSTAGTLSGLAATGRASVSADTTRANDDTRLTCSLPGAKANDLVWLVTVPERRRLVAVAQPTAGSPLRPAIALRSDCASMDAAANLACAQPPVGGSQSKLVLDVDPGTYFLWLEGEDGTDGAFTLDVTLEIPPVSDSCSQPKVVRIDSNGIVEFDGDTRDLKDDAAGSCGGLGAADAVFALQLSSPRQLAIELKGLTNGFDPVVYLRSACDDASPKSQVACVKASTTSNITGPTPLIIPRVEAGTVFLFVDGQMQTLATSGTFHLKITSLDPLTPQNDTCSSAQALVIPSGALGKLDTVKGDTSTAAGDALGCQGSGPDLVYELNLLMYPRQVLVTVTPQSGSGFRPVIYLRPQGKCASEVLTDQVACSVASTAGGPVTTLIPNLPAGLWYLWVDGADGSRGPFSLDIELGMPPAPPANDTCGGAIPVYLGSGVVNVQGTTLGANPDTSLCALPSSPDVVYSLNLPSTQSLAIDVKASTQLKPLVALRQPNACASLNPGDELACLLPDPQLPDHTVLTLPSLAAGNYFLWVSGLEATQGPFSLRVSSGAPFPVPANDQCTATQLPTLTQNTQVGGDTRGALNDDAALLCGLPPGGDGSGANDVAFRFSVAIQTTVTLTVTPDPIDGTLFRPVLYVRESTGCSSVTKTKGCTAATSYGGTATLTLPNLPAGTYTAWVDGAGQSSGKFTIKMQ